MKKFSKLIILCIFLSFLPSLLSARSDSKQMLEKVYNLAVTLQSNNCPKEAATEYKRYLFLIDCYPELKSGENHIYGSYLGLSDCYQALDNLELSISSLQNAMNLSQEDEKPHLQIKHINLLLKQAEETKTNLSNNIFFASYLLLDNFDSKVKKYAQLAHLENLIFLKNWEELSLWYDFYVTQTSDLFTQAEKDTFTQNLKEISEFKGKSPMLAAHLSFIPGLGQLYAHEYKDALNAFLLNGTLIGLCTWSLISQDYWIFSLFELNPTLRFYKGNIINAQRETYRYNSEQIKKLSDPLLNIIKLSYTKI